MFTYHSFWCRYGGATLETQAQLRPVLNDGVNPMTRAPCGGDKKHILLLNAHLRLMSLQDNDYTY